MQTINTLQRHFIYLGLKEHFTSEMLGLDIGNPELFNRHASSEHMVKVGVTCLAIVVTIVVTILCVYLLGNPLCRNVSQFVAVLP